MYTQCSIIIWSVHSGLIWHHNTSVLSYLKVPYQFLWNWHAPFALLANITCYIILKNCVSMVPSVNLISNRAASVTQKIKCCLFSSMWQLAHCRSCNQIWELDFIYSENITKYVELSAAGRTTRTYAAVPVSHMHILTHTYGEDRK